MIGVRIGEYLMRNGIKQSFLADKAGLTPMQVSDICNGKRKNIGLVEYYKICKALGVDFITFIEDGGAEV